MALDSVRREVLVHRDEVETVSRDPPGAGDPRGGADDHVVREPRLGERCEREDGCGRVAARIGDEPGAPDLVAMELREPVDRVRQELRRSVVAVGLLVDGRVVQPEVGGDVDHGHSGLDEACDDLGGRPVRVGDDRRLVAPGALRVELGQLDRDPVARIQAIQAGARVRPRRWPPRARGWDGGGPGSPQAPRQSPMPPRRPRGPHSRSDPPISASAALMASRRSVTSASVSVRSGARNSSLSARLLVPSPNCSPW